MTRLFGSIAVMLLAVTPAAPQSPQRGAMAPPPDELGACLLRSTSEADRALLMRWMFAIVALNPAVQSVVMVADTTRTNLNRETAGLMERLLTQACPAEARAALAARGAHAFEESFSLLGQTAAEGLFSHPLVVAGLEDFSRYLDVQKFQSLVQPDDQ